MTLKQLKEKIPCVFIRVKIGGEMFRGFLSGKHDRTCTVIIYNNPGYGFKVSWRKALKCYLEGRTLEERGGICRRSYVVR